MHLAIGERFPFLKGPTAEGRSLTVPDELRGHRAVLLFYRGHW